MNWSDEGYLLSKSNFDENSIIIEVFTLTHGKYAGIVYGGSSRKQKRNFQIGNKILLNWKSKNENKSGYFSTELIKPIAPLFFDDKKRSICLLSATTILKILLPERQTNRKIYNSFENMINEFHSENWVHLYIQWELSLIKELGYEFKFTDSEKVININNKFLKIPNLLLKNNNNEIHKSNIRDALFFNKNLLLEIFIIPNRLKLPLCRDILESYYL